MKLTIHRKTPVGTISVEEEIQHGTEPDAIRRMLPALDRACAAIERVPAPRPAMPAVEVLNKLARGETP